MGHIDRSVPRMLDQIMPELALTDVAAGVAYYRDVLGFSINYRQHDIAVMDRAERLVSRAFQPDAAQFS